MCNGNKSCTACQNKISGMKKRRRRPKVNIGPVAVGVSTLKNGAVFMGGFATAEFIAAKASAQVEQLQTTMAKAGVKAVLGTLTGIAAIKSKNMKLEGLIFASGMGASAIKDIAVTYLPGNIIAYLPTTSGDAVTVEERRADLRIRGLRLPATAIPRYPLSRQANPGQYANGGVKIRA